MALGPGGDERQALARNAQEIDGAIAEFLVALRGCWNRRMSWPVRGQGHSYQVCLGCGAKRLFDEKNFCSYGPYRYDLNELIEWRRIHPVNRSRPGTSGDQLRSL